MLVRKFLNGIAEKFIHFWKLIKSKSILRNQNRIYKIGWLSLIAIWELKRYKKKSISPRDF